MRSAWLRLLPLLSGSMLFGLVVLELVVRALEPEGGARSQFIAPDVVLHHRFIPGARGRDRQSEFDVSYAINALGLRDREMPRRKPAGTKRILMLGDSFTEGVGVEQEQTFSARIQVLLEQDGLGGRWQVVNGGVASYSPLLEYLYLKNGGLDLEPDLVILNFDLSDVYDDIQYTAQAEIDAAGDPVAVRAEARAFTKSQRWRAEVSDLDRSLVSPPLEAVIGIKDFVKEHLQLYGFVRRRIAVHVAATKQINASGDIHVDKFAMLRESYQPAGDRDWSLSFRYIRMIRDLLAGRGIGFWVTVYPYGMQVSPRECRTGRRLLGFAADRVYTTAPQDHLEQFCRRSGIPVLNLCEDFRTLDHTTDPLYHDVNGHWRPAGHELVASVLYRSLASHLREHDARVPTGVGEPSSGASADSSAPHAVSRASSRTLAGSPRKADAGHGVGGSSRFP